jgi:tRNA U34 5-methylaminomethyl-2-thiouridine-forming methyltransferase MnmC
LQLTVDTWLLAFAEAGRQTQTMTPKLHKTRFDDNNLLFSEQFEDHYFSRHDGSAESRHVFMAGNDLPERWSHKTNFTIGELGFGTGLNFLVSWQAWIRNRRPEQQLTFVSVEGFPLDSGSAGRALSKWPELAQLTDGLLSRWREISDPVQLDAQTILHVHHLPVEQALDGFPKVNAWYLDGFAPSKNPDMWSKSVMQSIAQHTAPEGTFASYTAAGWVRRNLAEAGFDVEIRPGFGTKRHMIAGVLQ